MRKYSSPGIEYVESERMAIGEPPVESVIGIIGFANKGEFEPKEVNSVTELHDIYGSAYLGKGEDGTDLYSKAIIAAERVLAYSDKIVFCRLPLIAEDVSQFFVDSDYVTFTVGNNDATVEKVELRQNYIEDDYGVNYTYDILLHMRGLSTPQLVAEGVTKENLEKAVTTDGRLVDFKIKEEAFPMPNPEETLNEMIFIEDGVSEPDKSIVFEVAELPKTKSVTLEFGDYDESIGTSYAENESIKVLVNQEAKVTSENYNFTEDNDWTDESKAFRISVNQPPEITEHEYIFDENGWAGLDNLVHADGKHVYKFCRGKMRVTGRRWSTDSHSSDRSYMNANEFRATFSTNPDGLEVQYIEIYVSKTLWSLSLKKYIYQYRITFIFTDGSTSEIMDVPEEDLTDRIIRGIFWPAPNDDIPVIFTFMPTSDFPLKQNGPMSTYYSCIIKHDGDRYSLYTRATEGATPTEKFNATKEDFYYKFMQASGIGGVEIKDGMTGRNVPIWQTPYINIPRLTISEAEDSKGSYRATYLKSVDGDLSTHYIPSSGTPESADSLVEDIAASGVFTIEDIHTDDRDYPIGQSPLIEYDSVTISEVNSIYSVSVTKDSETKSILRSATKDEFFSLLNSEGTLTIENKVPLDSPSFPIYQGVLPSFLYLLIEKNSDDTYTVKVNDSGYEVPIVENVEKKDLLSALNNAEYDYGTVTGYKPFVNAYQNTWGVDYPIIQYSKSTSEVYDIDVSPIRSRYDVATLSDICGILANTDIYAINTVIAPIGNLIEYDLYSKNSTRRAEDLIISTYHSINTALINLCESRGDCICCIDYPTFYTLAGVKDFFTNRYDTSFACTAYPSATYKSPYLGVPITLPPSVMLASQFAYTDSVKDCWFSPAGYGDNRGVIEGAYAVERDLSKDDRDALYLLGINPIIRNSSSHVVLYGNRTLKSVPKYTEPSETSFLNIRRMCNYIRSVVIWESNKIVFEPNDAMSWDNWKNLIRPYLRKVKDGRGIENFKIVMDRSIITEEDLANGQARGIIYVMPTHSIEYISIEFIMTQDSVIFDEEE